MVTEMKNPVELVNNKSASVYSIWLTTGSDTLIWDGQHFQTHKNIDVATDGILQPEQLVKQYKLALNSANQLQIDCSLTIIGLEPRG